MARPKTDTRARLLAAAIDTAAEHGFSQLSLRQLADHLGTSHRMLLFHFGSKDALLLEIVRAVEQQQRDAVAPSATHGHEPGADSPAARMNEFWDRLRAPAMWPYERLFFEVYVQAMRGTEPAVQLLDHDVDSWVDAMVAMLTDVGIEPATARVDARLMLAVCRGLLLDLVANGDPGAVDAAMRRFGSFLLSAHPELRPAGPGSR